MDLHDCLRSQWVRMRYVNRHWYDWSHIQWHDETGRLKRAYQRARGRCIAGRGQVQAHVINTVIVLEGAAELVFRRMIDRLPPLTDMFSFMPRSMTSGYGRIRDLLLHAGEMRTVIDEPELDEDIHIASELYVLLLVHRFQWITALD